MEQKPSQERFLEENPALEKRWQALSLNMQAWYERWAMAGHGKVMRSGDVMGTYTSIESHIAISSVDTPLIGEQMDRLLDWYRGLRPLRGGICWYLQQTPPGDLGARLFARGFEPNWQPHWMWCELRDLRSNYTHSSSFDIQIMEDEPGKLVEDLPYYRPEETAMRSALQRMYPRRVLSLAAFQNQQLVGRCMLNVTMSEAGVAGLFSMGVIPAARKQGIGTALVQTACELARQIGCRHVVLNATPMGEPVYRRVGFQSMGYGHTWCFFERTLAAPAPAPERVAFLEAIGRGDTAALDAMDKHLEKTVLQESLASGLTPLDIAVRCQQPASANWLIERGVPLDLLSAWDLGWKERIPALLGKHPELVNVQQGDMRLTPLHIAVERNDIELARLLLTVPHNLDLKDTQFRSTALGWARYFERNEIIALIEQHCVSQK